MRPKRRAALQEKLVQHHSLNCLVGPGWRFDPPFSFVGKTPPQQYDAEQRDRPRRRRASQKAEARLRIVLRCPLWANVTAIGIAMGRVGTVWPDVQD